VLVQGWHHSGQAVGSARASRLTAGQPLYRPGALPRSEPPPAIGPLHLHLYGDTAEDIAAILARRIDELARRDE
jgi:hypothetical protein